MTIKTDVSRFHIHDELTAPEGSVRILKSVYGAAGEISKFIGVLAGAPAALRAYARMRHELRAGVLPQATRERIALAVAEWRGDSYSIAQHARTARGAGLGIDEVTRARRFQSGDPKHQALLTFLESLLKSEGRPDQHLAEEAREVNWTDEELLEAVALVAMNEFQCLIANAAALPVDKADSAVLPAAA